MKRFAFLTAVLAISTMLSADDWLQFRGSTGNPVADADVPTKWSDKENVAWKSALPGRGLSSPIVIGDRVVVTCSSGYKQDRLYVLCFDVESGKELWRREFWATGRTFTHPTSAVAANTPASDGKSIFAFFSSADLACLDLDGNLLWYRGLSHDYPKSGNDVGMSSSPVVADGVVVVQVESQGDSFATGIDADTGETLWRIARGRQSNWASPVVLPGKGARKAVFLLQSADGLTAHEFRSGKELWKYGQPCKTTPSPVVADDSLYLPTENGLTRLDFTDDSNAFELKWEANKLSPGSSSPVVHDDRVYTLSGSVLKCASAESGKILWEKRVGGKRYWATPVIARKLMYCANQDGDVEVVDLTAAKGEIVETNSMGEAFFGTPAIAGNALYIRSDKHLWKIAKDNK
jgi:outer membrane protein assembly factor BamB